MGNNMKKKANITTNDFKNSEKSICYICETEFKVGTHAKDVISNFTIFRSLII